VFDGDPAPQKKRHSPTQYLVHVYCGQTAGWIKMPFGTEVNLGPGDVALHGVAAPPKRGTHPSSGSMSIVAKRLDGSWMKTPLCTEVDLGPGDIVLGGEPASPLFGLCLLWAFCGRGCPSQLLSSCSCFQACAVLASWLKIEKEHLSRFVL